MSLRVVGRRDGGECLVEVTPFVADDFTQHYPLDCILDDRI